MSQRQLESVLGRMITDAAFRVRLYVDTASVCREHGIELNPDELTALLRIDSRALGALAGQLDPRIVRALTLSPRREAAVRTSRSASAVRGAGDPRQRRSA